MSAWHDPRGRLIVDGEGRTVRREDQFIPEIAWPENGLIRYCQRCDGRYLLPPLRCGGHHETPHSCRPERRHDQPAELRSQIDRMRNSDYTEDVTARACGDLDVLACIVEVTS